ncbi:MAG: oligosaccharide flippase family protein [Dehalococcoidia bacterium]|jgi:O-antigen/teichoic acid export membrane protein
MTRHGAPALLKSLRDINLVFVTYVAGYLLAFVLQILVARGLGTQGRGTYEIVLLSVSLAQATLSMGVGVAVLYYLSKRTYSLRELLSNSQWVVLASTVLSGLFVLIAAPTFGSKLLAEGVPYWVFILSVPLFLDFNLLIAFLQAENRFLAMNSVILLQPVVMVALLIAGVLGGGLTTTNVFIFWSLSPLVPVFLGLWLLGLRNLHLPTVLWPRWSLLREQVRFGIQGQPGNILQLLNYRIDKYVALIFVGRDGVGIYAIAVGVTESIWFIANAVAVVLVPRLTRAHSDEAAELTPLFCRHTLFLSLLGAAACGVASPVLLPLIFGSAYSPAVVAVWWLLPGTVALAATKVLSGYIFSQGKPLINSYITVASLVVTVAADLALIPIFGVPGAAAASSLAYTTSLVLSLAAYQRLSGRPAWRTLAINAGDLRLYLLAARFVLTRRSSTQPVASDVEGGA